MLVTANVLALQAADLFGEDAGGFSVFVNAIGVLVLTAAGVGAAIRWQVPDNRIGSILIVGALTIMSIFVAWPLTVVLSDATGLAGLIAGLAAWWGNVILVPGLFLLFPMLTILFPDGHLPGHGWRGPFAAIVAVLAAGVVLQSIAPWTLSYQQPIPNPLAVPGIPTWLSAAGGGLAALALFAGLALGLAGLIVRFRRSTGVERAQIKWLVAAIALMAVVFPISFATDVGPDDLIDVASVLVGTLMPLAIGVAILRYRLYDIDRLVSRTVSWAIVTGVLVAIFGGLVIGLQAVLTDVTQGETLAVAASTLIAFALFQPLRRRVQRTVDRRFDRARYDGRHTVEAFAREIQNDVDLPRLRDTLTTTARDAVHPAMAAVWLRRADES